MVPASRRRRPGGARILAIVILSPILLLGTISGARATVAPDPGPPAARADTTDPAAADDAGSGLLLGIGRTGIGLGAVTHVN